MNEINGYSLFNDIEDVSLRNRNRAVVLSNMVEQYTKKDKITPKGQYLILSYFEAINNEDKLDVEKRFREEVKLRGYCVS